MILRKIQKQIEQSLGNKKSVLLLGPRQTGKSTLIQQIGVDHEFNLSNQSVFLEFARDPLYLEQSLKAILPKGGLVFIDEVQRVSSVLNTIQYLIDKKKGYQFILTGSSARKLKKGKANLLPGRLHAYDLGPVVSSELGYQANTNSLLAFGALPGVITEMQSREIKKLLRSYTTTYLNEEIKAEALTKNLEGFTRFLFNIAVDSTKYMDLTKVSKMIAVPRQTTQRFFEILEDTLLVQRLEVFAKSEKRRLIQHPRFFIFDNGVLNSLLNNFNVSADRIGQLFENLFITQLMTSLKSGDLEFRLSSYRTDAGAEVDVVLEVNNKIYAIEIKSGQFAKSSLGGLRSFKKFVGQQVECIVVVPDGQQKVIEDIQVMPWQNFLKSLKI
ncbi:MAG: ATP-binding protein [Pseudobdellovibrionaceae bacterium]